VTNAAMNMDVYISVVLFSLLLGIYTEVELLDHMSTLLLIFLGTATLFFIVVAHHFTFPPTRVCESFNFSTSLPMLLSFYFCF